MVTRVARTTQPGAATRLECRDAGSGEAKVRDMTAKTLYQRLGGYDGVVAFVDDLLPRLRDDEELGRFWQHRGADGVARERQLLVDFLCASCGGPLYYTGRSMTLTHRGMGISGEDWERFVCHATATLQALSIPETESAEIGRFVSSLKNEIVDA